MSGQAAFNRAEASARESEVKTLASADAAANERLASAPPAAGTTMAAPKRIAGRLFVDRDGVWTDLAYIAGSPDVTVAPFSPAYFALVRALPELPLVSAATGRRRRRMAIRVDSTGLTDWQGDRLATTVQYFRQ
jgi:hypothetical protein